MTRQTRSAFLIAYTSCRIEGTRHTVDTDKVIIGINDLTSSSWARVATDPVFRTKKAKLTSIARAAAHIWRRCPVCAWRTVILLDITLEFSGRALEAWSFFISILRIITLRAIAITFSSCSFVAHNLIINKETVCKLTLSCEGKISVYKFIIEKFSNRI